jgi:hypothetical protein
MSVLLDKVYPRSLDRIVSAHTAEAPGSRLEFWTFDCAEDRREAERRLSAGGVEVRIRSAYKSLLHFFLEELSLEGLSRAEVVYPVQPGCSPERFLLEAYPLSALLPGVDVQFSAETGAADGGEARAGARPGGFSYLLRLFYGDGSQETLEVFAPARIREDHADESVLASAGWMRLRSADGRLTEGAFGTEYEEIFSEAMKTVSEYPWGDSEPFFGQLSLRVALPIRDLPLPVGEEAISLMEAMHEELYFSVLEFFQKRTGRELSDRRISPGQVVPEISYGELPSLRVELKDLPAESVTARGEDGEESGEEPEDLALAMHPLSAARVRAELDAIAAGIEHRVIRALSYSGRTIPGIYHPGTDAAVMISGGQHANETTGVVGALRAARELARKPGSHFSVSPLENPDGYELHRLFCLENPRHMHHAARYTALGNDLEYQKEGCFHEKTMRVEAEGLSRAKLHINLHGYPSHEWTRPLSGYIPRGFPSWTLPHGFFLVLRHHAAWAEAAEEFIERLSLRLADVPGLKEFTAEQLSIYADYVGTPPFRIIHGFPCDLCVNENSGIALRLITEYPDETIHGDAFAAGHRAQKETALAAYEIFQSMMSEARAAGRDIPGTGREAREERT